VTLHTVTIEGGTIKGTAQGGLIYSSTQVTITASSLSGGTAREGGGVFITGVSSSPSYFIDSSISDCTATEKTGLEAGNTGGCFYIDENDASS
jgi:hypothetical protein